MICISDLLKVNSQMTQMCYNYGWFAKRWSLFQLAPFTKVLESGRKDDDTIGGSY